MQEWLNVAQDYSQTGYGHQCEYTLANSMECTSEMMDLFTCEKVCKKQENNAEITQCST